jgi:hypothetical protein
MAERYLEMLAAFTGGWFLTDIPGWSRAAWRWLRRQFRR